MRRLTSVLILVLSAALWTQARNPASVHAQDAKPDAKEAADLNRATGQIKNLALAMHHYHDVNRTLPPAAVVNRDGKPLLSWRVLLLPYVDEAKLFAEFKLDEPWDSAHNKSLLTRRPKVYEPVRKDAGAGLTYYQVFHGAGAGFEGHKPLRIPSDFPDGTSNTMIVVEAAEAVPWTKPADLIYDAKKPVPKVGAMFKDVFLAGFADGSVHRLKKSIKESTLRLLITRNDGMPLPADAFD